VERELDKELEFTMNQPITVPDSETVARSVARWQEVCNRLDALNVLLDEAIAQVEEDNRRSPLYQYRLERAKKLLDARSRS
jgi:hypothetical protein